jgi:sarcosine oxidase subunit gamma
MASIPQQYARRSPVYPRLASAGATFTEVEGTAIGATYPDTPAPPLGLVDLSPLPRVGIKGPRAWSWLREQGWPVPAHNNLGAVTAQGDRVISLSDREALVLAAPVGTGEAVTHLERSIPGDGAWHAPRRDSHCAFLMRGDDVTACMAKLCGVDLRPGPFPDESAAQTSVARLSAIVYRIGLDATPSVLLLTDRASAIWFWDVLLDAMNEFGGGPLGVDEIAVQP